MAQTDASRIVTLCLKGPLHVGQFIGVEREAALAWAPADTLFGALVSAWAVLGQDVTAMLAGFRAGKPPFILTSAFPRAGTVRFYPRPWLYHYPANLFERERKRTKRLQWISEGVLERLVAGESLAGEGEDDNFIQGSAIWLTRAEQASLPKSIKQDENGRVWGYQSAPRVTVDRADSHSNLFHTGRVNFAPECGLWFGVRFLSDDPAWPEQVKTALAYLADAGLGGLRSTGHGAFTWAWERKDIPAAPQAGSLALTLSRYAPRDADELQATLLGKASTAYRLVTVGGWCRDDQLHPWRRRSVCMVTEGSLLAWDERATAGHLVNVTPEGVGVFGDAHRVWRYGYAFPVPVSPAAGQRQEE
jgi:CRISPR-associated protein Csm4